MNGTPYICVCTEILYIQHNSELLSTKWLISISHSHQIGPMMSSVLTRTPPLKK